MKLLLLAAFVVLYATVEASPAPTTTVDPCLKTQYVTQCSQRCQRRPSRSCRRYCRRRLSATGQRRVRRTCRRSCRRATHDKCIDECIQFREVGCRRNAASGVTTAAPGAATTAPASSRRARRCARRVARLNRRLARCRKDKCKQRITRKLQRVQTRCNAASSSSSSRTGRRSRRSRRRRCARRVRHVRRRLSSCKSRRLRRRLNRRLRRVQRRCRRFLSRRTRRRISRARRARRARRVRRVRAARRSRRIVAKLSRRCRRSIRSMRKRLHACSDRKCTRNLSSRLRRTIRHCRRPRARKITRRRGSRRCSSSVFRRRRTVHRRKLERLQKAAQRCGDLDSACVDRAYKRIASYKRRIRRFRVHWSRRCGGSVKLSLTTSCSAKKFARWLRSQRSKRARIQRAVRLCGDEDVNCVNNQLKLLLQLNRAIRKNSRRCGHSAARIKRNVARTVAHKKKSTNCGAWVHSGKWKKSVTCDGMNKKFHAWLTFAQCRRQKYFEESCRCSPVDVSCLRFTYQSMRRIQRTIAQARNAFVEHISRCDVCAPLKLRFRRWLIRQRARRHRYHLAACQCAALDITCMQENVDAIKVIQQRIALRRSQVLRLHSDCRMGKTTAYVFTQTTDDYAIVTGGPTTTTTTTAATTAAASTYAPAASAGPASVVTGAANNGLPAPGQLRVYRRG